MRAPTTSPLNTPPPEVPLLNYHGSPQTVEDDKASFSGDEESGNSVFSEGRAYFAERGWKEGEQTGGFEARRNPRSWSRGAAVSSRESWRRSCVNVAALAAVGILGVLVGSRKSFQPPVVENVLVSLGDDQSNSRCNPYEQRGILRVDTGEPSGNAWEPISAPASCQPIDYTARLKQGKDVPFARNRLIVIYGDSVDRGHNEQMCKFIGGDREMIAADHPWSPPYPKGFEHTHPGYENREYGEAKEWPSNPQSRPYVCHLKSHNLVILNVFHYGFLPVDGFINHHPHYYPPGVFEDRIDMVIRPLVAKITEAYHLNPKPDIVSLSPGFWDILRLSVDKNEHRDKAIDNGMDEDEAKSKWDRFIVMIPEKRDFFRKRIEESIRHVAMAWGDVGIKSHWAPRILWRSLHHVAFYDDIPYVQVQAIEQIGRAVFEELVLEGRAADRKANGSFSTHGDTFKGMREINSYVSLGATEESEILEQGLGRRLKLDDWGLLLLGNELHYEDPIHPSPLPGGYLYSNMLLQQLKMAVEDAEGLSGF